MFYSLRLVALLLVSWAIINSGSECGAQVSRAVVGTVNIAEALDRPPADIAAQVFGQPTTAPRFAFEVRVEDHSLAVLDLGALVDEHCGNVWSQPGPQLVYRDGVLVGAIPNLEAFFSEGLPPLVDSFAVVNGRIRRVSSDADRNDAPAPLPFERGLGSVREALMAPPEAPLSFNIRCVSVDNARSGSLQTLPLLPLLFFQPFENGSRANAQRFGADLYDLVQVGYPLPEDFSQRARDWRVRLRQHSNADDSYRIMTFDMSGPRSSGLAQPRGVGYIGIRGSVVEWKAMEPSLSNMMGAPLCVSLDGRRGRVRDGCSSTGYYQP
jgi:hypothetical protein